MKKWKVRQMTRAEVVVKLTFDEAREYGDEWLWETVECYGGNREMKRNEAILHLGLRQYAKECEGEFEEELRSRGLIEKDERFLLIPGEE